MAAVTAISNALPAGNNNIGDVDIASIVSGTGATNLGKAEDAAHSSGDVGVMALAVRNDAGTALAGTTGDYIPLSTDANGALRVVGSSGTTQYTEDAASVGAESVCLTGFVRQDTIASSTSTDGDYAYGKVNSNGAQYVAIESGGVSGRAEDSAHSSGHEGVVFLAVRRDSASSGVDTDGDYATLSVDSSGNLRTTGSSGVTSYTEDAASAGAESLVLMGAVRRDTAASSSGTDGDYSTINVDASGRVHVNVGALPASTNTIEVVGDVAHDAAAAGNPVLLGAYASAAAPTDVSADADAVRIWALRSGAVATQPTYAGVLSVAGNGASGTGVQRVTIANDSTANIATIGTSVTPGTSAAHLGKAEDAAHASGDTGVMSLGVRSDTAAAASGTTGDYEPFHTDSVGALWSRSTGELADDAAFTPGTSRVFPVGLQADETATDSVDEGDVGAPRMTLDRKQIVTLQPHTQGGLSIFRSLDIDETEEDVKTSAGQLYFIHAMNMVATARYLKFYNATAANVTVGSTTPVLTMPLPANSTTGAGFTVSIPQGFEFTTAICVACTTGVADADTGAPGANDVIINLGYK